MGTWIPGVFDCDAWFVQPLGPVAPELALLYRAFLFPVISAARFGLNGRLSPALFDAGRTDQGMNAGKPTTTVEEDLKLAEAALEVARELPAGPKRFEALKKAGQLRYDAENRRMKSERAPGNKRTVKP